MGKFVSSPIELKIEPINAVPYYEAGFAPYFINLSLCIGAMLIGLLTISIVFNTLGEKMQSAIEGKKEEAM